MLWEFQQGIKVDEVTGVLSALNRGVGLKVEFSLNENIDETIAPGTDVNRDWVAKRPTSFGINQKKILLRLALTDETLYEYDNKYKKIELSLENILRVIILDSNWLKLVELSNNTKDLQINEDQALAQLMSALPNDKPN